MPHSPPDWPEQYPPRRPPYGPLLLPLSVRPELRKSRSTNTSKPPFAMTWSRPGSREVCMLRPGSASVKPPLLPQPAPKNSAPLSPPEPPRDPPSFTPTLLPHFPPETHSIWWSKPPFHLPSCSPISPLAGTGIRQWSIGCRSPAASPAGTASGATAGPKCAHTDANTKSGWALPARAVADASKLLIARQVANARNNGRRNATWS